MSPKIRTTLFITLTILFIILGTTLVLYSRGARFDFKNWEVIQTGGIYLKTEPADVKIEMDGKPIKNRAGILQSGTLISNLKPGTYKIFIQRDNYHSWQKEIQVESSTVAVLDGIILFPKDEAELVASPTNKFLSELTGEEISKVELTQLNSLFNQLKEEQLRLPGPVPISKVRSYPYNDRKFIIMTDRALYALDTERRMVSQISPRAKDFTFAGNDVFWFEDRGLYSFNLILRNQSQINLPPELKVVEWKEIQLAPSGEIVAVLKKDDELIIWDRSTNKVTSLGQSVASFVFSPNSKKIAFAKDDFLNVYAIKDGAKKETYLLEGARGKWSAIERILWHEDSNYIFLKDRNNNLYYVEVNEYPPVNIVEATTQVKNFVYRENDDSLYWEDPRGIWRVKL